MRMLTIDIKSNYQDGQASRCFLTGTLDLHLTPFGPLVYKNILIDISVKNAALEHDLTVALFYPPEGQRDIFCQQIQTSKSIAASSTPLANLDLVGLLGNSLEKKELMCMKSRTITNHVTAVTTHTVKIPY